MSPARLIAQQWLMTAAVIARELGEAAHNSLGLVAIALNPPKRSAPHRHAPYEGTWYERAFGLTSKD